MRLTRSRATVTFGVLAVVVVLAVLTARQSDEALRRDVERFAVPHIRENLLRLRKSYPEHHVRDALDECVALYDRDIVTFLYVSIPERAILHYAQVHDAERPGLYYVAFSIDQLRSRAKSLLRNNFEDFVVLVYLHECMHVIDADGKSVNPGDEPAALKAESRVWWDTTEYLIRMRQAGRATEVLDQGMELALRFYMACGEVPECERWQRFIATGHRTPGSTPIDELVKELPPIR